MTVRHSPKVELYYDSTWNDITNDVRVADGINIRRGRADEAYQADPGSLSITLDNTDGRYVPRNPASPLYGKLGRNTPIRVSEGTLADTPTTVVSDTFSRTVLVGWGTADSHHDWRTQGGTVDDFSTTGTQGRIVGDVDFRWAWTEVSMSDAETLFSVSVDQVATGEDLTFGAMFRYNQTSPDHKYYRCRANLEPGGSISILVARGLTPVGSTVPLAATYSAGTKLWMRARVDGHRVRGKLWVDGSAEPGSWQIDETVTDDTIDSGGMGFITSAVGGNTNVDPTYSFDSITISELNPDEYRFVGEVANWPVRWDTSGTNSVHTTIEANGILRRLNQGASPLRSAYYRELMLSEWRQTPVAYWPMEDQDGAVRLAAAVGGIPLRVSGQPSVGSYDGFAASEPVVTMESGASITAALPPYSDTGILSLLFLLHIPEGGIFDGAVLIRAYFNGTAGRWDLIYGVGGSLTLKAYDEDAFLLYTSGPWAFDLDDAQQVVGFTLDQNGANIDTAIRRYEISDNSATGSVGTGTLNSRTIGNMTQIYIGPNLNMQGASMGHLNISSYLDQDLGTDDWMFGWNGEPAGMRLKRLCEEEGVPFVTREDLWNTEPMGAQRGSKKFLDLINECADTDGGILTELRSQLGLSYVTRAALYNQTPAATLGYSTLSEPFEPEEDDQQIRNDVTVDRERGSSARSYRAIGEMSVLPPPDGVGRYEDFKTLSLSTDEQCLNQAAWRVYLGTWNDLRYPSVTVDLAKNPSLKTVVTSLDSGKIVKVTGLPDWLPPDDILLMTQGYEEYFDQFAWKVKLNTTPGGLWYVFQVGDSTYGRLDTSGSYLLLGSLTASSFDVSPSTSYIIVPDAEAAFFSVGDECQLWTDAGILKEGTVFTVTSKDSAFGLTNIHFSPAAQQAPQAADNIKRCDETSFSVATEGLFAPWINTTDRPGDFPFNIKVNGEVMAVTAITGGLSPQLFTVTRSVNGVVKSHLGGSRIQISR